MPAVPFDFSALSGFGEIRIIREVMFKTETSKNQSRKQLDGHCLEWEDSKTSRLVTMPGL